VLLSPLPAAAQGDLTGLCALFLQQQQTELEDFELAVEADETRLQVAEELFGLLDDLWRNDIAERLFYLGVKHRRDAADVNLQRSRRLLERQQAAVEQYRLACSVPTAQEGTSGDRPSIDEANRRYLEADCELRALDVTAFEVDLEYYQEVLEGARDLRQHDVASRQQVLFAEQDLQLTTQQLEQAMQRWARCRQS
jgi:hypothetical protein